MYNCTDLQINIHVLWRRSSSFTSFNYKKSINAPNMYFAIPDYKLQLQMALQMQMWHFSAIIEPLYSQRHPVATQRKIITVNEIKLDCNLKVCCSNSFTRLMKIYNDHLTIERKYHSFHKYAFKCIEYENLII